MENQKANSYVAENAEVQNAEVVAENAELQNAELQNAELQNAELQNAEVQNAEVQNAELQNAELQNAELQNAELQNAELQNAELQNAEMLTNEDAPDVNVATDNSFQNFQAQLQQGFLNVIARQNAMARNLDPTSRTTKIKSAIQKVKQMPNLGDYKSAILMRTWDFEEAIVNGFLNNIYRKNLVQRIYNKATGASTKKQRTIAIQNALENVNKMTDLGSYILQSFADAANTNLSLAKSLAKNFRKGGKYKTKRGGRKTKRGGRKTKRGGRKTKRGGRKTKKGGRKTKRGGRKTKRGGRKTNMTKKRW